MGGTQHLDVLRSLGLVSRSGRRHVSIPLVWNGLIMHKRGRELAMLLTLLGAGSMGVALALRYTSGASVPITFPWSETGERHVPSDQKKMADLEEQELTVPGLQNMGNNCFLNVVLQALSSSEVLVSFMEECSRMNCAQVVESVQSAMPLAVAVSALFNELAQGGVAQRILSPRRVMRALGLYAQQFDLDAQQDAAEALAHLAAGLQEERHDYLQSHRPIMQSFGTVLSKESPLATIHQSWLHWPLEGTLGSLMACQRCGFQFSTQFQFFNDIPLSPVRQADGNIIYGCTLEDCLDHFTAPEWVASVKCSHCAHMAATQVLRSQMDINKATPSQNKSLTETEEQLRILEKCSCDDDCACEALTLEQGGVWTSVHTNASKRLRIGRSPEVLCLQVQRAVMNEVGELRKLMGHVEFPMVLDLFPYTVAAQEGPIRSTDTKTETHSDSLLQMLRQRGVLLSHVRRLQGTGFEGTLFPPDLGIKGGSAVREQEAASVESTLVGPSKDAEQAVHNNSSIGEEEENSVGDERVHDLQEIPKSSSSVEGVADEASENGTANGILPKHSGDHHVSTNEEMMETQSTEQIDASGPSTAENEALSLSTCVPIGFDPNINKILTTQVAEESHTQEVKEAKPKKVLNTRKLLYELLSVVVHHGGPHNGHYTVYRRVRLPTKNSIECVTESPSSSSAENLSAGNATQIIAEGGDVQLLRSDNSDPAEKTSGERVEKVTVVGISGSQEFKDPRRGEVITDALTRERETEVVWFKVSDTNVKRVEELEVRLANASLVFYERLKG